MADFAALRRNFPTDLIAGLTTGLVAIPDAMAGAVIAGINPVHGLYAVIAGLILGSLTTGSVFMSVVVTGALSVATREAIASRPADEAVMVLITLTCLVGVFQVLAGVLRLGWILRFVSHSVMTGFLTGVALLIILGQLDQLTGYESKAHGALAKTWDLFGHLPRVQPASLAVGTLTVLLILAFQHTRLRFLSMLLALAIVSVAVRFMGWDVPLVGDSSRIPQQLPTLALPHLSVVPQLLLPALSLTLIGLVQGAGVSHSHPNPDGTYPNVSRDFWGQGIANLGSAFLGGMPVGGSVAGTALVVAAGALSRWANLIAGLVVALVILLAGSWVELLPMPALAGMLMVAGWQALNFPRIFSVLRTHWAPAFAMFLTFAGTLYLRIELAVLVGVAASILMHVYRSSHELRIRELKLAKPFPKEGPVPERLTSGQVTVLQPYGSLFFASAHVLEDKLPKVGSARQPVVLLLLRGHHELGSTVLGVLTRYSRALRENDGRLMLVGVSRTIHQQLLRTRMLEDIGEENVFPATAEYGHAFAAAYHSAAGWLQRSPGVT